MKPIFFKSLILILIFGLSITLFGQRISPTSDMAEKRFGHEIQTLPNGKVLVFGGQTLTELFQPVYYNSCEIYDPAIETWSSAAPMTESRSKFASVVTNEGKILAIGGEGPENNRTSVESYNPDTDTWTLVGHTAWPRKNGDAVVLNDGRILLLASNNVTFEEGPADGSGTWVEHVVPDGVAIPSLPRLIKMSDGRVLVAGGSAGVPNSMPVVFDGFIPSNIGMPCEMGHPEPGLAILPDGTIMITNGSAGRECEIYDPQSNTISQTGKYTYARYGCTLMLMENGNVAAFAIGNPSMVEEDKQVLEIYNPETGEWNIIPGHDFNGTQYHEVAKMGNGKWLITGGANNNEMLGLGSDKAFVFDENDASSNVREVKQDFAEVFYNPISKEVNIQLQQSYFGDHIKLQFVSISGQMISDQPFTGNNLTIPAGHLPPGIYILNLLNSTVNSIQSNKLLIR